MTLNNYRLIIVLQSKARVFERLLYDQIYPTENKLPENQQFSFRSIHPTALALGKSVNKWLMMYRVSQKKYPCLMKLKMHNKRRIYKIETFLGQQRAYLNCDILVVIFGCHLTEV